MHNENDRFKIDRHPDLIYSMITWSDIQNYKYKSRQWDID